MASPLYWRPILGSLGISLVSVAACLYTIFQLGALSGRARSVLDGDQRMIGYQEALTDSFLSEVRYGGKFIFTHAEDRHEQMQQFKKDFARYMEQLKSIKGPGEIAASLSRVEQFHRQYDELFDREVAYIRAKQSYAQSRYQQERDKIFDSALRELASLKALLQTNLQTNLQGLDRAARIARQIGILAVIVVTVLVALFLVMIARNVAAPWKQLESNTASDATRPSRRSQIAIEKKEKPFASRASMTPLPLRLIAVVGCPLIMWTRWCWEKAPRLRKAGNQ